MGATQVSYYYTGSAQTWTCPAYGLLGPVTVTAAGAAGAGSSAVAGGKGDVVTASFTPTPGQTYNIYAGGVSGWGLHAGGVGASQGAYGLAGSGSGGGSSGITLPDGTVLVEAGAGGGAGTSSADFAGGAGGWGGGTVFRSGAANYTTFALPISGASLTVPLPPGTAAGDLLLVLTDAGNSGIFTAAAGVTAFSDTQATLRFGVSKVVTSSDVTAGAATIATVTDSGSGSYTVRYVAVAYANAGATPVDVSNVGSGVSPYFASVTTTKADVVVYMSGDGSPTNVSPTVRFTGSADGASFWVGDLAQTAAGAASCALSAGSYAAVVGLVAPAGNGAPGAGPAGETPGGGGAATAAAAGSGGTGGFYADNAGASGSGGAGGRGGPLPPNEPSSAGGGGGGGGHYGGGGGGAGPEISGGGVPGGGTTNAGGAGGGGGSSYASASMGSPSYAPGTNSGNGTVTLSYSTANAIDMII